MSCMEVSSYSVIQSLYLHASLIVEDRAAPNVNTVSLQVHAFDLKHNVTVSRVLEVGSSLLSRPYRFRGVVCQSMRG